MSFLNEYEYAAASVLLVSAFPPDVGTWLQTFAPIQPQERQ